MTITTDYRENLNFHGNPSKQQVRDMENAKKWALEWLKSPKNQYINGEWTEGQGQEWKARNPADGTVLTSFLLGTKEQVTYAAATAHSAFSSGIWPATSRGERGKILHEIADLIRNNMEKLAALETLANGKLFQESAVDDIPTCAEIFDYYAGWVDKYYGVTSPVDCGYLNYSLIEPVGVCGLIAPWNFPLYQAALKIAPALAMGNTIIIKPSEFTPFTAIYLVELIDTYLDLPPGVITLLVTDGEAANSLTTSHDVDKVSFTGSTMVGKKLVQNSGASNLKAVTLELGGKSPCIIFNDTPDLDAAIDRAFTVMFSHKGEKCSEPTRFLIEDGIYDRVVSALIQKAEAVRCGDPFAGTSTQGAQCNRAQFEKILNYIEIGKGEAELVAGGEADRAGDNGKGFFIRPTIFSNVKRDSRIAKEEIFGPVLACTRFCTDDEAVALANDTVYGLAAGIYTANINRAHRLAEQIDAGMIFINRYGCYGLSSPFGGFKQSGWGKEMAVHSLASYTKEKSIWVSFGK